LGELGLKAAEAGPIRLRQETRQETKKGIRSVRIVVAWDRGLKYLPCENAVGQVRATRLKVAISGTRLCARASAGTD
jgi:hypothetical protein